VKSRRKIPYALLFAILLACAGMLYAQGSASRSLIVNGKPAGQVVQFGGHSYIDLETVAQFTNGTVAIEQNRVLLSIAGLETGPAPAPAAPPPPPPPPAGLSREFARQAIAELAEMREWRGAIGTILAYGVPVVGTWPQDYRDRVGADLNQLSVAAATASDRDALQLLSNEYGNLARWADATVATRNSLNATKTVSPNAAQNDPDLTKISECSRFLNSMLVSSVFADDPSCH
jgi:hypothetical protein